MEKGQLRCDCNVSVRPEGQTELGTKIEIKNMNSISGVRRALAYEIERQRDCLGRGEALVQSTRRWDDDAGQTFQMRTKESAHDYRYFPDPDLLPVKTAVFMPEVHTRRPELPAEKRDRFVGKFGVTSYDANVLASQRALADYFDAAAEGARKPKAVANWVLNDLLSALSGSGLDISASPIPPQALRELVDLIDGGTISREQGREVFTEMLASGKAAAQIVEERGLKQESDTGAIDALCAQGHRGESEGGSRLSRGQSAIDQFPQRAGDETFPGKSKPEPW
jgi:aspartyl-tRNA(Asn)/glutamyl-tRNA(Gln) amidotransferase subunit B